FTDSSDFAVDRIGGQNALATVFFIVRPTSQPERSCVPGTMQWILDNLRSIEPAIHLGSEFPAGVFTVAKRSGLGLMAWGSTGCRTTKVIGTVKHRAWSTDGFYTFDVVLDEFQGAFLVSTNKGVRIEVDPLDPNDWDGENPAHQAIK